MDCIELDRKTIDAIARKTAKMFVAELRRQQDMEARGLIPIKEAASILGVSVSHLREIKDKFPYVKYGEGKYGRLFFKKDALVPVMSSLTVDPNALKTGESGV